MATNIYGTVNFKGDGKIDLFVYNKIITSYSLLSALTWYDEYIIDADGNTREHTD